MSEQDKFGNSISSEEEEVSSKNLSGEESGSNKNEPFSSVYDEEDSKKKQKSFGLEKIRGTRSIEKRRVFVGKRAKRRKSDGRVLERYDFFYRR